MSLVAREEVRARRTERIVELAGRYARRLEATGRASLAAATPADVEGFVWAPTRRGQPPSPHTLHLRRTAVGGLYRTLARLGVDAGDPSRHVALPPKTRRVARPLDDAEIALVRTAALAHRRWPQAAVANLLRRLLADAGVAAGDVKPSSIRLWAARRALDDGASIETVAVLLGLASLDAAADAVGYHWQPKADPR